MANYKNLAVNVANLHYCHDIGQNDNKKSSGSTRAKITQPMNDQTIVE